MICASAVPGVLRHRSDRRHVHQHVDEAHRVEAASTHDVEKQYTEAAKRIEQVQQMQEKQRTMAHRRS